MNENHQRHLLSALQYVDNLLSQAEHIMASAGTASPFQQYSQDTTPIQRKVLHDYIVRVREVMQRILTELKIPRNPPISGALWAARGHLNFANIAVAEIEPQHMRGYGKLSDEDAQTMDRIVAELNTELNRIRDYLAQGSTADLQSRLQRLEQTRDEVKLLRELERIVTAHGLVEFRPTLLMLLDRLETASFEVGVFGRVSSGKSSLLNYLLGQNVLPVGVTPVTAVPLRISFGNEAEAVIEFADAAPQRIALGQLSEFSSEQENPSNRKHVMRIRVRIPATRLRDGVTFVDTPGLGSLATTGAEETVAYLPKCDLGIVLLDAGTALNHEDLVIVQSLYRSGATAMVLISKADLLAPPDRERTVTYVRRHLLSEVNLNLPVHLVSVVGDHAQLCEQWFDNDLRALLESRHEATANSLKRKIGLLREALLDVLRGRLDAIQGRAIQSSEEWIRATEEMRTANALLEEAENEGRNLAYNLRELAPMALQTIATEISAAWLNGGSPADGATIFSASLNRFMTQQSFTVAQSVEKVRARLESALQQAHVASGSCRESSEELPKAAALPVVDCSPLSIKLALRRPRLLPLLGQGALRRFVESKILEQLDESFSEFLNLMGKRLERWHNEALADLRDAFDAHAGIYRAQFWRYESSATDEALADEASLQKDISLLEQWECSRKTKIVFGDMTNELIAGNGSSSGALSPCKTQLTHEPN